MTQLSRCTHCPGFLPSTASRCPHCGQARPTSPLARRLIALLAIAGSGSVALTLMACYGSPCATNESCWEPPPKEDMSVHVAPDLAEAPDGGVDGGH